MFELVKQRQWTLTDVLIGLFAASAVWFLLGVFVFGFLKALADQKDMPELVELCNNSAVLQRHISDHCDEWRTWGSFMPVVVAYHATRDYVLSSPYMAIGGLGLSLVLFSHRVLEWVQPVQRYHLAKAE